MIGIQGQYSFLFSVGPFRDFITPDDIEVFRVVESIGNLLPEFEIRFYIRNFDVMELLVEGNVINLSIGSSDSNLSESRIRIMSTKIEPVGANMYFYTIYGLYDCVGYIYNFTSKIYKDMLSTEVIFNVGERCFGEVINEAGEPDDRMTWVQSCIGSKKFIDDVLKKSYIKGSTLNVHIDFLGRMVIRDLKSQIDNKDSHYKFTILPENIEKDRVFNPDEYSKNIQGLAGYLGAIGKEVIKYNLITGMYEVYVQDVSPLISNNDDIIRNTTMKKRTSWCGVLSDNINSNIVLGSERNSQTALNIIQNKIILNFNNVYSDVNILDVVTFSRDSILNSGSLGLRDGKYFITKIARIISKSSFTYTVEISSESLNVRDAKNVSVN